MDLLPTPEQDEIVASIRSVIAGNHTLGEPLTDALWAAAASQGWFGLGLDESLGGVGYSVVEEMLLFRELGRACVPGPFLATALGARVAALAGDSETATRVIGGEARVALAEPYDERRHALTDAAGATYVLTAGATAALHDAAEPTDLEEIDGFDVLVPVTLATMTSGPRVATVDGDAATDVTRRGGLLVAAMLAGIARATTEQSVAYGIDREQFGQPVGGFQAVKHRCADMATRAEAADCQLSYAALALRDGRADAEFHVAAARVTAARAAIDNAEINVQNHGGIGFTWEHTAHRYVTRARLWARTFGDTPSHLRAALDATAPL